MSERGSPMMLRMMRYCEGRSVLTGRTFRATGLYFFFCPMYAGEGSTFSGVSDVLEIA